MKTLGKRSTTGLLVFFGGLLAFLLVQAAAGAAQVKGTATYRERIALTPDAVFEAMLEDVSKADAPAVVVGSVRIDKPGRFRFDSKSPLIQRASNRDAATRCVLASWLAKSCC
jgi:hypothetical protein